MITLDEILLASAYPVCKLQMFARELHSGWTSWGNEALKFQSTHNFLHTGMSQRA